MCPTDDNLLTVSAAVAKLWRYARGGYSGDLCGCGERSSGNVWRRPSAATPRVYVSSVFVHRSASCVVRGSSVL